MKGYLVDVSWVKKKALTAWKVSIAKTLRIECGVDT